MLLGVSVCSPVLGPLKASAHTAPDGDLPSQGHLQEGPLVAKCVALPSAGTCVRPGRWKASPGGWWALLLRSLPLPAVEAVCSGGLGVGNLGWSSGLSWPRFPGSGAAGGGRGEHQGPSKPGLQAGLAGGRREGSSCRRPACSVGLAHWLPYPPCLGSACFVFSVHGTVV